MRSQWDSGRWIVVAASVALVAPLALAGKPGGGTTPPADPAITCLKSGDRGKELVVMNADGTNARTLVATNGVEMSSADWSPDGTKLAFIYGGPQGPGVYVINVDGTGLSKLVSVDATTEPQYWWSRVPRWSPVATADGNPKIAYVDTGVGGVTRALFVINTDGTGRTQLTSTGASSNALLGVRGTAWSPDARFVAVDVNDYPRYDVVVHEIGVVGGALAVTSTVNLTDDASVPGGTLNARSVSSPSWARTGSRIAVDASGAVAGDQYNVWVIDLANPATPTRVTPSTGTEQVDPCWSPDDAKLVVSQWTNARCIDTMNADGSGNVQIAKGSRSSGYFTPTWRRNP